MSASSGGLLFDGAGRQAIGVSGSAIFSPGAHVAASTMTGYAPDAAYIFSGTVGGTNKTVFFGDVVVSGSLTKSGGGASVDTDGTGASTRLAFWNDSDTIAGSANLVFDGTDATIGSAGKLEFRDTTTYLNSPMAGALAVSTNYLMMKPALYSELAVSGSGFTISGSNGSIIAGGLEGDGKGYLTVTGSSGVSIGGAITFSGGTADITHDLNGGTIDIDTATMFMVDSAGGVSIDAADTSNISTSGGEMNVSGSDGVNLAGAVTFSGSSADITHDLNGGAFDIDAVSAVTVDVSAGGVSLDGTDDSNFTVTAAAKDLVLAVAGGGAQKLQLDSAGTGTDAIDISATAGGVDIDASGALNLDGGSINIGIAADVAIDVDSSTFDLDASGAVTIDTSAGGVSIDAAAGAVNVTAAASSLTLAGQTLNVDATSGAADIDATTSVTVGGTNATFVSLGRSGRSVRVVGNLEVQGTTTTVSSSHMVVKDSLIGLGYSGSNTTTSGGDRGLLFGRAAQQWDANPTLWYNGTGFNLATTITDPTSGSVGSVGSYLPLVAGAVTLFGDLKPAADDTYDLGSTVLAWQDAYLEGNLYFTDAGGVSCTGEFSVTGSSNIVLSASADITLDANDGVIDFKDGGTLFLELDGATTAGDCIFSDAGETEIFRIDGSEDSLRMASSKKIQLGAVEEYIYGDGTDIHFGVGSSGNINIPASIGLTFGDDGEKIYGDGTDLAVSSSNDLLFDAGGEIILDADGGVWDFKNGGTDIFSIEDSSSDVVLQPQVANKDIIFQEDGGNEICRMDSSGESLLMASTKKIEFSDTNAYIHHDGTDLKLADDADINLVAGADVLLDAAADIILDAAGGDVAFKVAGVSNVEVKMDGTGVVDIETKVSNESLRLRVNDGGSGRTLLELEPDSSVGSNADIVIGHTGMAAGEIALIPKVDNVVDLGGASNRFRNIYTGDLNLQNDRGNWTLIEESGFISFRNNDTGKRYKMLMEEITGDGNYGPGNDGIL